MGGNLYKVGRVTKERYKEIVASLLPILDKHFGAYYRIPIPYHNKKNYGDVDIILDAGFLLNRNWEEPLLKDMGVVQVKKVRNVTSILYWDFQVDFFCVGTSKFESTYNFMCYNILGNLIGRIYHKFNLKYGEHGLSYVMRSYNNHSIHEVQVSKDMKRMLEFVDLSYDRWKLGFDNLIDIFQYVIGSKYFCASQYSDEYFNVRKRATQRPDFNTFLDYLKENNITKNYPFSYNREVYLPTIIEAFPEVNLQERYDKHNAIQVKLENIAKKFNGKLIMELTPLRGADLGKFINDYKKYKGNDFDEIILISSQEYINKSIVEFYEDQSIKHLFEC